MLEFLSGIAVIFTISALYWKNKYDKLEKKNSFLMDMDSDLEDRMAYLLQEAIEIKETNNRLLMKNNTLKSEIKLLRAKNK